MQSSLEPWNLPSAPMFVTPNVSCLRSPPVGPTPHWRKPMSPLSQSGLVFSVLRYQTLLYWYSGVHIKRSYLMGIAWDDYRVKQKVISLYESHRSHTQVLMLDIKNVSYFSNFLGGVLLSLMSWAFLRWKPSLPLEI